MARGKPARSLGLIVAVATVTFACSRLGAQPGSLHVDRVTSEAIAGNLLGESAEIEVAVYTPPGYADGNARYPVLYLLHGIVGTYRDWTGGGYQGLRIHDELDALIGAGSVPPMIVVMPTARNRYLGSYYADSPVTGNWGEFVASELVAWTDANYRTLAASGGRGIAGHSMGGYGALTLSMDHPGVFGAAFAMSPCCLQLTDDLGSANPAWRQALAFGAHDEVQAAAQAGQLYPVAIMGLLSVATPDEDAPPFFVDFPFRFGQAGFPLEDEPAHTRYRSFFPVERLDETAAALRDLRGLAIDVGHDDQFSHIVPGAMAVSQRLGELHVPHLFEIYDGDHRNRMRARLTSVVLPFFDRHLDPSRP